MYKGIFKKARSRNPLFLPGTPAAPPNDIMHPYGRVKRLNPKETRGIIIVYLNRKKELIKLFKNHP